MTWLKEMRPKRVIDNPSDTDLRRWALDQGGIITQFGNLAVFTEVRNRLARLTEIITEEPNGGVMQTLMDVQDYVANNEMIQVDRVMCTTPEFKTNCRLYVSAKYARLALMWGSTLFPSEGGDPDFVTIDIPEWKDKHIFVFPASGVTVALGSDYKGEIKKSMLRQLMYWAKTHGGGLGVHAGSKLIRVRRDSELKDFGCIFFGNSGTGKTTLSGHTHWLRYPEGVTIRQDDVVVIQPDTSAVGTEDSFYIKTENLEPKVQPLLYAAAIAPRAILENVGVDVMNGDVDFFDATYTSNGRAMVKRRDIAYTDDLIDLPRTDFIFFITRRYDIQPPVVRLSPEWGAAAFMLGESVETSAGDPSRAGESIRVVGTNPFIVGSVAEEGNMFLRFLRANPDIQCFTLNTGTVGSVNGQKIRIIDTVKIIEMIARDEIRWTKDDFWGYEVPTEIPGVDLDRFDLQRYYLDEDVRKMSEQLRQERVQWLEQFADLDPDITAVLQR